MSSRFKPPGVVYEYLEYFASKCQLALFESAEHYENTAIQYTVIFHGCKNDYFQKKNCDSFLIFAQKHRSLVHVRTASLVYPSKPQFYYIKVGCKGVFVTRTCFRDGSRGQLAYEASF